MYGDGTECAHRDNQLRCEDGKRVFPCHLHGEITFDRCFDCADFRPIPAPYKFTWGVAVTTSPRDESYLDATCESLAAAGWDDPSVFHDEDKTLGSFGNFYRAMATLVVQQPWACGYLYCQDDVTLHPKSREITEAVVRSASMIDCGGWWVASLYRGSRKVLSRHEPNAEFSEDGTDATWQKYDRGWNTLGACCLAFSPRGLRDLLTDAMVLRHKWHGYEYGLDGCVGEWAAKNGGIWYRDPSLVRHEGIKSAIWPVDWKEDAEDIEDDSGCSANALKT